MVLHNGISVGIRKKHIRIGNKFDCVEGVNGENENWSFTHIGLYTHIGPYMSAIMYTTRVRFLASWAEYSAERNWCDSKGNLWMLAIGSGNALICALCQPKFQVWSGPSKICQHSSFGNLATSGIQEWVSLWVQGRGYRDSPLETAWEAVTV